MKYYILKPQNIVEFDTKPQLYEVTKEVFLQKLADFSNKRKWTTVSPFANHYKTLLEHLFSGTSHLSSEYLMLDDTFFVVRGYGISILPRLIDEDELKKRYVVPFKVPFK